MRKLTFFLCISVLAGCANLRPAADQGNTGPFKVVCAHEGTVVSFEMEQSSGRNVEIDATENNPCGITKIKFMQGDDRSDGAAQVIAAEAAREKNLWNALGNGIASIFAIFVPL